jgi:NAD-dependent deacetylase
MIRSVCVLTGAGVSAESGVPTFRGNDGLWKKFRPEELANIEAFLSNPEIVWEWYAYRRRVLSEVVPNAAHEGIARIEQHIPEFLLVTQNVDGLHQVAGSKKMVELHGNIRRNHCHSCGENAVTLPETNQGDVPRCEACGGLLRPSVVWFGEMLPSEAFQKAERAARDCDLCVLIGTSGVVYPAASIPHTAKTGGAYLLEINPEGTDLSRYADGIIRAPATEGVPILADAIQSIT